MNFNTFKAGDARLKDFSKIKKSFIYNIRSYMFEKYGVWDIIDVFPYRWRMYYWEIIRPIFNPSNQRIRKFIPRTYVDITRLMVDVNFEFIKAFYEDEYKADIVDWEATEHHAEFARWLESAYKYIVTDRPQLEIDLSNAYPPFKSFDEMFRPFVNKDGKKMFELSGDGIPYEVKYKEVNRIEQLIEDTDTEILTQFVKRRDYFWT